MSFIQLCKINSNQLFQTSERMMKIHKIFETIFFLFYTSSFVLQIGETVSSKGLKDLLTDADAQTSHSGGGAQQPFHHDRKRIFHRSEAFHYAGQTIEHTAASPEVRGVKFLISGNPDPDAGGAKLQSILVVPRHSLLVMVMHTDSNNCFMPRRVFSIVHIHSIMSDGKLDIHPQGNDAKFYMSILKSLLQRCGYEMFAKEAVCSTVNQLHNWFTQLDKKLRILMRENSPDATDEDEADPRVDIQNISITICIVINRDGLDLEEKYLNRLRNDVARQIQEEIARIVASGATGGNMLIAEYKENYGKVIKDESKKTKEIAAYKILCILRQMGQKVINDEEAKRAFAYRQFAINLAIHTLHLGPSNLIGKDAIMAIAQRWPPYIPIWPSDNLPKREADFHTSVVVPMVEICDWYFGYEFKEDSATDKGYQKFCGGIVKKLNTLLIRWSDLYEYQELGQKEIDTCPTKFYNIVLEDMEELKLEYEQGDASARGYSHTVMSEITTQAGENGEHLETLFKKTFHDLIEQTIIEEATGYIPGNDDSKKLAYTLLCICTKIHMIPNMPGEVKDALAFRQIGVNLAIHSLLLGLPSGSEGRKSDIFKIAISWQNYMRDGEGETSGVSAV